MLLVGGVKCYAEHFQAMPFMILFFIMVTYLVVSVFWMNKKPGLTPQFTKHLNNFKEEKGSIDYVRSKQDELMLALGDKDYFTGNLLTAFTALSEAYEDANDAAYGSTASDSSD